MCLSKTKINGHRDPRDTLYPQKLELILPTSGSRSVSVVCLRLKPWSLVLLYIQCPHIDIPTELISFRISNTVSEKTPSLSVHCPLFHTLVGCHSSEHPHTNVNVFAAAIHAWWNVMDWWLDLFSLYSLGRTAWESPSPTVPILSCVYSWLWERLLTS
jgi:hypothetical protein